MAGKRKWKTKEEERRRVRRAAREAESVEDPPLRLVEEDDAAAEPDGEEASAEEGGLRVVPSERQRRRARRKAVPRTARIIYRVTFVLLIAALALAVFENRDHLTPQNLANWVRTRVVGFGYGEGYPAGIPGSGAEPGNFGADDGNVYVVSDTALTVLNSTAKELFSARHSYNAPAVAAANGRFLLYNMGGSGYRVENASGTQVSGVAEADITVGTICASGKFALCIQPTDYASRLLVFKSDGTLQYRYDFADTHITAVALNGEGTKGAVAAVTSRSGELVTEITFLDFSSPEPISVLETRGNLIFGLLWARSGRLLAVGDAAVLVGNERGLDAYDYGGSTVTAYCLTENRAVVSVSNYAYGGDSTLLIFRDSAEPLAVPLEQRASWLSSAGGKVAALLPGEVISVDLTTGRAESSCAAQNDTKAIAMGDEGSVYLLGVRELRRENLSVIRQNANGEE